MIRLDRAVGIDLGTTHSEIALLAPSERDVLIYQDRFGRSTIPSAVLWDDAKQAFVVGRAAKAARASDRAVLSVKRSMGQAKKIVLGPHELLPEEISAKILAELVGSMKTFLKEKAAEDVAFEVTRAVITVPAYFDAPQVEATRRAGELAGLTVLGILQEPTAAAIHHTFQSRVSSGNFLVFDLGGGTFDVSILKCVAGEYQVLAIDGDNFLGGDDFDRRLAEHLRKRLVEKGYALELDLRGNEADRGRFESLLGLAEELKHSLSTSTVVSLSRESVLVDQSGEPVSIEIEMSREEHAKLIGDLLERAIECALRAVAESERVAGVGLADIDRVILVGGSTRVPALQDLVTERLSSKCKNVELVRESVDTVVALGAAVHAAELGGLIISNEEASLHFTSRFVTDSARLRVGMTVLEPADASAVEVHEGERVAGESSIDEKRRARVELEVPEDAETTFSAVLKRGGGELAAGIPFVVYRGTPKPRPTALSRPSVTSKDLAVEVVRQGMRDRKVLIPRGTGLPTETTQNFATADKSGAVVLRILEGRLPIKTLALPVSKETPVGTRVELTIRCDESMRVEATATVLGQKLWAKVEPIANPPMSTEDIEQLLEDAEQLVRGFWGNVGDAVRRDVEFLTASVRETIGTDPVKLVAHATRLRRLVTDLGESSADGMSPSVALFESELHALQKLVYRSQGYLVGMDREAWEKRIASLTEKAERAREARDNVAFRRVYNEVQALYETANQEEFASRKPDDPSTLLRRATNAERWASRLERGLLDLELSSTPELLSLQQAERERLLGLIHACKFDPIKDALAQDGADVRTLRQRIEGIEAELERVDEATQRVPSLGLVTDRGPDRRGNA